MTTHHIFGIRHHGPGSARSLQQALTALQPDIILVEGPPDANDLLPLMLETEMQPPVALLIYAADSTQQAVYYPFAIFSPEWHAIAFGLQRQIPVRFMDLPQCHQLIAANSDETTAPESLDTEQNPTIPASDDRIFRTDPLTLIAQAAGYHDGERWWEHMVEQRLDSSEIFAAILEAMTALRTEIDTQQRPPDERELQREAYMRQTIRAAHKEGFQKIAIVCGAWHAPALVDLQDSKTDREILKSLPKTKVNATWVPWTHDRLSYHTGYGAGVESPGWYHHLWSMPQIDAQATAIGWMTRVARLLREKDLDASSASVIEAVRLAESLAAMRDRAMPTLAELNEATQTVLCFGDDTPLQLIHRQLIVGEELGTVPAATPMVPLQQDLSAQQKRLRLKVESSEQPLELDLRKQTDLERSYLFHRLNLLDLPWGKLRQSSGKGTFKETWQLKWQPEFVIPLIEAGIWGNTILAAATNYTRTTADRTTDLPTLTALLDRSLLADIPTAIEHLLIRLQAEAAIASDIAHLMNALPPLANVVRYGNVRQVDTTTVGRVVTGLVTRICIGLGNACASLNAEAATAMDERIAATNRAINLIQDPAQITLWQTTLTQLADRSGLHGSIAGLCCRLLLDAGIFDATAVAQRLSLALSIAAEPPQAAAWVEGLLKGSGLLLIHNEALWQVIDDWVLALPSDNFTTVLPLLRRTFANFAPAERRQMGNRVRQGGTVRVATGGESELDLDRATAILPLAKQLLGLS